SSAVRSSYQPGRLSQSTATQRECARCSEKEDGGAGAGAGEGAGGPGVGAGAGGGRVEHAAATPRIAGHQRPRNDCNMWLIVLEALAALVLLGLIVWWTMFAGRRRGERYTKDE